MIDAPDSGISPSSSQVGDQALENTVNPQSLSSNQEVPADDEVGLVTRAEFMAMLDRKNQAVNEYFDKQIQEMTDRYKREIERGSHGGVTVKPYLVQLTRLVPMLTKGHIERLIELS